MAKRSVSRRPHAAAVDDRAAAPGLWSRPPKVSAGRAIPAVLPDRERRLRRRPSAGMPRAPVPAHRLPPVGIARSGGSRGGLGRSRAAAQAARSSGAQALPEPSRWTDRRGDGDQPQRGAGPLGEGAGGAAARSVMPSEPAIGPGHRCRGPQRPAPGRGSPHPAPAAAAGAAHAGGIACRTAQPARDGAAGGRHHHPSRVMPGGRAGPYVRSKRDVQGLRAGESRPAGRPGPKGTCGPRAGRPAGDRPGRGQQS